MRRAAGHIPGAMILFLVTALITSCKPDASSKSAGGKLGESGTYGCNDKSGRASFSSPSQFKPTCAIYGDLSGIVSLQITRDDFKNATFMIQWMGSASPQPGEVKIQPDRSPSQIQNIASASDDKSGVFNGNVSAVFVGAAPSVFFTFDGKHCDSMAGANVITGTLNLTKVGKKKGERTAGSFNLACGNDKIVGSFDAPYVDLADSLNSIK